MDFWEFCAGYVRLFRRVRIDDKTLSLIKFTGATIGLDNPEGYCSEAGTDEFLGGTLPEMMTTAGASMIRRHIEPYVRNLRNWLARIEPAHAALTRRVTNSSAAVG